MNERVAALGKGLVEDVEISIRGGMESSPTKGQVSIITWSPQERSKRALKLLGLCWGIGLFCVILPLVHFVLVPGMVIAGIIGFLHMSKQTTLVLGGVGVCPECQKEFKVAKAADHFPMAETCESCNSSVSLSKTVRPTI